MKNIFLILLFGLTGCKTVSYISKDNEESAPRPVLHRSLLSDDGFSEAAIQQILNSKIKFPIPARLGVIRLTNNSITDSYNYSKSRTSSTYEIDDGFVTGFFNTLHNSKNIKTVIPVPKSLIAYNPNFKQLRSSAVIVQADLLLVINSDTETNWDFKFNEASRIAKGKSNVEAYLMDVRTGIISLSGVYSDSAELKFESNKDYDIQETMKRVKLEAEKKVFSQLAKDVLEFVNSKK